MSKDAVFRLSEVLSSICLKVLRKTTIYIGQNNVCPGQTQTVHITQRVTATLTLLPYVICFFIRVVHLTTLPYIKLCNVK